jgi:putative hydrolase of the HAD superfamily
MNQPIDAILFDMGGTLRSRTRRLQRINKDKIHEMITLLGMDIEELKFIGLLKEHARAYKDWSGKTLRELNELEIWRDWMIPDWPSEQVSRIAPQLSKLWRDATSREIVSFPETQETVQALFNRGYRLGLVSNTTSSTEGPRLLEELGIAGCFEAIILSCVVGIRKPDPTILLMATERMGARPEHCAYIGDQPRRDVAAARKAGFGKTIILRDPKHHSNLPQETTLIPDYTIYNLKDLLDIFPPKFRRKITHQEMKEVIYDASLSTMWAKTKFPIFGDFFLAARKLGFAKVELNHHINSGMLSSVDLGKYKLSSLHEPCPADISVDTLKQRDWMISSPDEDCRQQGVASVKRSIDLADKLSVRTVVVHAGHVSLDMVLEKKLRSLYEDKLAGSTEFQETKNLMVERRLELIDPHLEAVRKSLKDLLEFASRFGVRLGLENRYHYYDIPTQDEMSLLLDLAGPDQLGFIYDVGHAMVLDRLGFMPNEIWLKRFGMRIFGTHLHDVIGLLDHQAPGQGNVDFRLVAGYLPRDAFRTMEVMSFNTPEQIKTGLEILVDTGCVNKIQ